MSVLIDMEKPTKCEFCVLVRLSSTGESLVCGYSYDTVSWDEGKPPFTCPLVEIPPHGRLGDLDALLDDIEHSIVFSGKECSQAIAGAQKVIERIKAAPTIIESNGMESFVKHFED